MKKICALLLTFLMLVQSIGGFVFAANESDSPKHIPRVVSVVFDDSGSMKDTFDLQGRVPGKELDRWAYASYAMQAFIAMMGSEDKLYLTKLEEDTVEVNLSNKDYEINKFKNITRDDFVSNTNNVVKQAVEPLLDEYDTYGADAKYYLVAMSDGVLQTGEDWATVLKNADKETKNALEGADFSTIFFSMGDLGKINGIESETATSGEEIVDRIKKVSNKVMGRTDITNGSKVKGGVITFDLKYPALSLSVFVQKANATFEDIRFDVKKDGKTAKFDVETSTVKCPVSELGEVKNPPAGFVANITGGTKALAKGKYEIDLSKYNLVSDDVVVLVEPAVKIGCKYYVGDSTEPVEFDKVKDSLRVGQTLKIQCGLYEMNDDGTLGEEVPDSVLSPEFALKVNDIPVTEKVKGQKNTYKITMDEEKVGKQLEIKASIPNYQPFVQRETFTGLASLPSITKKADDILLTKPMFRDWTQGKGKITFYLPDVDDSLVASLEIKVNGYDGIPVGRASELSGVTYTKNSVSFGMSISGKKDFDSLPENFTVELYDVYSGDLVDDVKVTKVIPSYKIDVENELSGKDVSLAMLSENDKTVTFTLSADYDGSGKYVSVDKMGCEDEIKANVEMGILSGKTEQKGGTVVYTPSYDVQNSDSSAFDVIGKDVSVYAVMEVDGKTVESEKVSFSFGAAQYKIVVAETISDSLTLDSIKTNSNKVVFKLLADYEGDGTYGELSLTDTSAKEMKIDTGKFALPGKTGVEYGILGNPVGVYFIPVYDETTSTKPFTEVAGKKHVITANFGDVTEKTTVEVLSPKFDVSVRKDGLEIQDYHLCENTDGVEFTVARDERILSVTELEGLAPYDITLGNKNGKKLVIKTRVEKSDDGTAYLVVVPTHKNKSIFTRWLSFFVNHGTTEITLTAGNDSDTASIEIGIDLPELFKYLIILAIILYLLYVAFCYSTMLMFPNGRFYPVTFAKKEGKTGYYFKSLGKPIKANPSRFKAFFFADKSPRRRKEKEKSKFKRFIKKIGSIIVKFFPVPVPFMTISRNITFNGERAVFVTKKGHSTRLFSKIYPHFVLNGASVRDFLDYSNFNNFVARALAKDETLVIRSAGRRFQLTSEEELKRLKDGEAISVYDERSDKIHVLFFITNKELSRLEKERKAAKKIARAKRNKR